MIVRITEVTTIRLLTLQPGDEIHVQTMPPTLQTLVDSARIDGVKVARIVGDEDEYAITRGRGGRRGTT